MFVLAEQPVLGAAKSGPDCCWEWQRNRVCHSGVGGCAQHRLVQRGRADAHRRSHAGWGLRATAGPDSVTAAVASKWFGGSHITPDA
jgi:hypothetical protein